MTAPTRAAAAYAARACAAAARLGLTLALDGPAALDRKDSIRLKAPGRISPNGCCRLIAAHDGWLAVNLARRDDHELLPAWLGVDCGDDPWRTIAQVARDSAAAAMVAQARLLGLPVARVGEIEAHPAVEAKAGHSRAARHLRVLDLSALWAGPLCAGILARAGLDVVRLENIRRPDPTPRSLPALDRRLNAAKRRIAFDFAARDALRARIMAADIVVTSARRRAFAAMNLVPEEIIAARPDLIWIAISGYGWNGATADRVAFGDDAAAAGGLIGWHNGAPQFLGDALADPLTGLAAAGAALSALQHDAGGLIDVAMARVAADAALQ